MNRLADLNENGYRKIRQSVECDVPRMKIRTPVRWYSLSPVLNLGEEDVKARVCRHCEERGKRRGRDCDGLIDERGFCECRDRYWVVVG